MGALLWSLLSLSELDDVLSLDVLFLEVVRGVFTSFLTCLPLPNGFPFLDVFFSEEGPEGRSSDSPSELELSEVSSVVSAEDCVREVFLEDRRLFLFCCDFS